VQPVSAFHLRQNVPNPFNPVTKIAFDVPRGGAKVALHIYDVSGRLVRTLVDGFEPSGTRTASWYGRDDQGRPVASGTYYYQLTAPSFSERRKMLLLK
jgi:flagellar hook assembly protein FlgD